MARPVKPVVGFEGKSDIDLTSHILSTQELEFKNRLSEMEKAHAAEIKELKKEQAEYRALNDMSKWQKLTDLKINLEKTIRESDIAGWNLKKISSLMEYYTYQHPKKPVLKSSNESDTWVQEFIKNGGKLTTLIDTADKSRIATWQRISKPKKRKKKKAKEGENEGDNQTNLEKNLEGVKSDIRKETS